MSSRSMKATRSSIAASIRLARSNAAVMARALAAITRWGIDTHPCESIRRTVDPGADVHR